MNFKKGVVACLAMFVVFIMFQQTVKAEEVQSKELYTLENPTWLINEGFSKGVNHDRQDLGVVLSKGATLRIRQVNTAFTEKITVQMLNNDSKTEKSVAVGSDWVNITPDADAVPFVTTTFTSVKPKIEYQVIGNSVSLPKIEQGGNEAAFFSKWDANNASFALIGNKYIQFLIPTKDKYYLKKMNDFSSIDKLFAYYDNVFETYNELAGISFNPKSSTDKNIPNRYFAKANRSGGGGAYYGGSETAESSDSTISCWLTKGWGALHEIAHGYQGNFMNDNTYQVSEVWNNIYADTFKKRTAGSAYFTDAGLYAGGGGVNAVEAAFEKNVYKDKTAVNTWTNNQRFYVSVMLKDKVGDKAFINFNQRYRELTNKPGGFVSDQLLLDMLTEYYGEGSGFNIAPFVELIQGNMSDKQKTVAVNSSNKNVYPLAALVSGDNLAKARQDIALDSKWALVNNAQLTKYGLKQNIKLNLDIKDISQLKGQTLKMMDGSTVVKEVVIQGTTVELKDMPVGIYSVHLPSGTTKQYKTDKLYIPVTDKGADQTIKILDVPVLAGQILDTSKEVTFIGAPNSELIVNGVSYKNDVNGVYQITLPNYLKLGDKVEAKFVYASGEGSDLGTFTVGNGHLITSNVIVGKTDVFGTARPNSLVKVWIQGGVRATTTANAEGIWSAKLGSPMIEGNTVQTQVFDGSYVADSPRYTVTKGEKAINPAELVGDISNASTTAEFVGSAYATLTLDGKSYTADSAGIFVVNFDKPYIAGTILKAVTTDVWGQKSAIQEIRVLNKLTTKPTVTSALVEGATTVTGTAIPGAKVDVWIKGGIRAIVYADANGKWTAQVPALVEGQVVQPRATLEGKYEDSERYTIVRKKPKVTSLIVVGETTLTGTAIPGAKVDVWIRGGIRATVYADAKGLWTAEVPAMVAGEIVQPRAWVGNTYEDSERYTIVAKNPIVTSALVAGATTVSGTAPQGSKVDVWIYGLVRATVYADTSGKWTAEVPALVAGQIVQPRASIGSWYADSERYKIVPKEPVVTSSLVAGATTVTGIAAPRAMVDVWIYGMVRATVYADENGNWTANVPALVAGQVVQPRISIGSYYMADTIRYTVSK